MTSGSGSVDGVHMLDKGMIHVPGRTEWEGVRFHHTIQNGMQFKAYELYFRNFPFHISGLWLTAGNRPWQLKLWIRRDYCIANSLC